MRFRPVLYSKTLSQKQRKKRHQTGGRTRLLDRQDSYGERCDGRHRECPGDALPSHRAAWHFPHWLLVTGWLPWVEFWESESGAVPTSNLKMFVTKGCFGLW